jgi:uncharacterized membrane protein
MNDIKNLLPLPKKIVALIKVSSFGLMLFIIAKFLISSAHISDFQHKNARVTQFGPILASHPFVDTIQVKKIENFKGLSLKLATSYEKKNSSYVHFLFKDKQGTILHSEKVDVAGIEDNKYHPFKFDLPEILLDNQVVVEIISPTEDIDNAISIWTYADCTSKHAILYPYDSKEILWFLIFLLCTTVLIYIFTVIRQVSIPKYLLFNVLFFGICSIFVTPFNGVPDEAEHFNRIFKISQGDFIPSINRHLNPTHLNKVWGDRPVLGFDVFVPEHGRAIGFLQQKPFGYKLTEKYTQKERENVWTKMAPITSYSPFNYPPQVFAFWLGECLYDNPLTLFYLARLLALLAFACIVYFAISRLPSYQLFFASVVLLPMVIYQASSLSADSFNFALIFLVFSFILYGIKNKLSVKEHNFLFILMSCIGFLKLNLVFLTPFVWFIPNKHFPIYPRFMKALMVILPFLFAISWMYFGTSHLPIDKNLQVFSSPVEGILSILNSPISFIKIFAHTIQIKGLFYIKGMLGILGCRMEIYLSGIAYYIMSVVVLLSLSVEKGLTFSTKQRIFSLCLIFLFVLLMGCLTYLWTPKEYLQIYGIQGRYFVPLLPFLGIVLGNGILSKWRNKIEEFIKTILILVSFAFITTILFFYY